MRLFLFGSLRDCAEHLHGVELDAGAETLQQLLDWIGQHHEPLSQAIARPGVRFAVDQVFADRNAPLFPDSEIAFMSPLSGG